MHRLAFALLTITGAFLAAIVFAENSPSDSSTNGSPTPVLVELFTSEGCSSCPPADKLLQNFDKQPIPGAQLIVLSEHVDYWNHIGWSDPFSSSVYTQRQSAYGSRFRLESVYTPEMVVDGSSEFGGTDTKEAARVIARASAIPKIPVRISDLNIDGDQLKAHLETGTLPVKADVYVVVALNHAESQVAGGENSGRHLTHVAVARTFVKTGSVNAGESYTRNVSLKIDKKSDPSQLRVIAFIQQSGQGNILGASLAQPVRQP